LPPAACQIGRATHSPIIGTWPARNSACDGCFQPLQIGRHLCRVVAGAGAVRACNQNQHVDLLNSRLHARDCVKMHDIS
jgi:hypothetical protein